MLKNREKCYRISNILEAGKVLEENEKYYEKINKLVGNKNNKYHIFTMGCQLNENDSEKISGMLTKMGYIETDEFKEADFIIFNTCYYNL